MTQSAHFLLCAVWLASILVGILVQLRWAARDPSTRTTRAALHWKLDAFIKAPAFLGVFASGAFMLSSPHATDLAFLAMILPGVMSVFLGVFGLWLAYRRQVAARTQKWASFERVDQLERRLELLVLLGVLVAIAAGIQIGAAA